MTLNNNYQKRPSQPDLYELCGPRYPTPTYAERRKIDDIISAMLDASDARDVDQAQNLFYSAEEQGLHSKALYRTWIKIAGMYNRIDEAEKTFHTAQEQRALTVRTATVWLNILTRNGLIGKAQKTFHEMEECFMNTEFTYITWIQAAGKAGLMEEVKEALYSAQRRGEDSHALYTAAMDTLVENDDIRLAQQIWDNSTADIPHYEDHGQEIIDLHDFSHGIGLLYLLNRKEQTDLTIITGKGNDQKGNRFKLRSNLIRDIKKHAPFLEVSIDRWNEGRIHVRLKKENSPIDEPRKRKRNEASLSSKEGAPKKPRK